MSSLVSGCFVASLEWLLTGTRCSDPSAYEMVHNSQEQITPQVNVAAQELCGGLWGPREVAGVFSQTANTLESMKGSFFECENASTPVSFLY